VNVELITKEDLQQFKKELFAELKEFAREPNATGKQWLKSAEVRKLLKISPGTLQHLRINGTIRFTKVGSIFYYKQEDLHKLLEGLPEKGTGKEASWKP
jgi:hypothetical protein